MNTSTPVGSSRRHIGNELLATGKLTFCLRTFSRVAKKRPLFEGRALCHMFPSNVYFLIHSCYVRFTRAVSQRSDVNSHLCLSFTLLSRDLHANGPGPPCERQYCQLGTPQDQEACRSSSINKKIISNCVCI